MKLNYYKMYAALLQGEKVPRKAKKFCLGKRMKKNKLRLLLKSVKVLKPAKTMYENPLIEPHLFCPKCGCKESKGTGNRVAYPEHWEDFYCIRCSFHVAYIDTSPLIHCLEMAEHNYELI